MARKYKISGTKVYLWWSLGLLALGVWAVKDGWFPSEEMVKHQLFNKSLAVLSLIGSAVCAYVHWLVR